MDAAQVAQEPDFATAPSDSPPTVRIGGVVQAKSPVKIGLIALAVNFVLSVLLAWTLTRAGYVATHAGLQRIREPDSPWRGLVEIDASLARRFAPARNQTQ